MVFTSNHATFTLSGDDGYSKTFTGTYTYDSQTFEVDVTSGDFYNPYVYVSGSIKGRTMTLEVAEGTLDLIGHIYELRKQ